MPNKYKRSRVWFPEPDPKRSAKLLKFERMKLGRCVQWFTAFCNLMRHRHKKHDWIDPRCRLCGFHEETPEHLSFYCPRLNNQRTEYFRTYEGKPEDWQPNEVFSFTMIPTINEMLNDEQNYD